MSRKRLNVKYTEEDSDYSDKDDKLIHAEEYDYEEESDDSKDIFIKTPPKMKKEIKVNDQNKSSSSSSSKTKTGLESGLTSLLGGDKSDIPPEEIVPTYVIEESKSARSMCRMCEEKIAKNCIRVGVVSDSDWGLYSKFYHLECIVFDNSIDNAEILDGYNELKETNKLLVQERVLKSKTEVDPNKIPVNPDELVRKDWTEAHEPTDDLLMTLLPFQKEGLGWMLHQEESNNLGGILADEMGMGKTIQAVSLILSHRPEKVTSVKQGIEKVKWEESDINHGMDPKKIPHVGTLIVVPTIALRQWQMEINRYTSANALTIKIYHGDQRDISLKSFENVDIVLTTYKIIEIEYRKATNGTKVTCSICNKNFYPDKLRTHRKYFCGENAERTEGQSKTDKKKPRLKEMKAEPIVIESKDINKKNTIDKRKSHEIIKISDDSDYEIEVKNVKLNDSGSKGKGKKSIKKDNKKDNKKEFDDDNDNKNKKNKKEMKIEEEFDSDVERDILQALTDYKKKCGKEKSPVSILHQLSWFRIILDEAHMIKDRSTSTAKAVFNLCSLYKWCLTGTPLQNRVGELYSLVRFLRIDPHAYYYCRGKGCDCRHLNWKMTSGRCDYCNHSSMQHYCHFNKHILNPIKNSGYVGEGKKAMLKLKEQVLDEILLRRTKTTRADDIQLPPRIVRVRQEKLDEREEDYYQALYTQSQAQFNTYVASGTVLNNYAHIFDILIRLRQAVDHPYLVIHSATRNNSYSTTDISSRNNLISNDTEDNYFIPECGLCNDPVEDPVKSDCGHIFCKSCIIDYLDTVVGTGSKLLGIDNEIVADNDEDEFDDDNNNKKTKVKKIKKTKKTSEASAACPTCGEELTIDMNAEISFNQPSISPVSSSSSSSLCTSLGLWNNKIKKKKSIIDRIDLKHFQTSTKLEALMEELYKMQQKDLGAKAIVFSQFVNMLDLIEYRLLRGGIGCSKLQGSMNVDEREITIKSFKENVDIKVLLISLKAGGVALNLTVASHIFIMDPWWNPAAEMQAIDRTHRLGQHKPIFATRFIIENTIEERILCLQEKKKLVFDGTVGGDASSMARLTVDDMRFLFG